MGDLTPKENTALDIAMTRLGGLIDQMKKAGRRYPRERTWPDCEEELAQLRAEIERLRGLLQLVKRNREALGDAAD